MPITGLLHPPGSVPRNTPTEWVIWAVDADGVFFVYEGPGLSRKGLEQGAFVGRSVWEVHRENPAVLSYVRRALCEPASAELVFDGHRFRSSAMPLPGGGAVGLGLALEAPVAERQDPGDDSAPLVAELVREVPEVGGAKGDLLVWRPEKPGVVAFYREMSLEGLPPGVVQELLQLMTGSASGASGAAPAPDGTHPPPPGRAAHLRLLP